MSIWHTEPQLEPLNAMHVETAVRQLGIEFTEIGEDYLRATMEVDGRTKQPMGVLHGGATVVLAESLGSIGGSLCVDMAKYYCVGLSITANHTRAIRSGKVTGTARPVHLGRTTHVWDIRVVDEEDRLVNVSRLTLAVLAH